MLKAANSIKPSANNAGFASSPAGFVPFGFILTLKKAKGIEINMDKIWIPAENTHAALTGSFFRTGNTAQ